MMRKLLPTSSQGSVAVLAGIGLPLVGGSVELARASRQWVAAVLLTIAGALLLAGCGGQPVSLLTGWGALGPPENDMVGCYTNFAVGELVVDAEFGTALIEDGREAVPVMWPPGTTGRQAGSDVEVVNKKGEVIARTGNRYQIEGAGSARYPLPGWLACGYVLPK